MSPPDARVPCSLDALGMVNALGRGLEEIWPRLLDGDQSHLSLRDDLVPKRSLLLGAVYGTLCGVIVLLAMRPDRRSTEAVSAPATVVAALGGGGELWPVTAMVLLAALPESAMAELNAVAAGAELDGPGVLVAVLALPVALVLGLVDAFGSRALR